MHRPLLFLALACLLLVSCKDDLQKKPEQLTASEFSNPEDSLKYALRENTSFSQINSSVNSVVLTGLDSIRLVNIYKLRPETDRNINREEGTTYYPKSVDENGNFIKNAEDDFAYFMPGMDVISGYNLINVGHYDLASAKLSYFFKKPVLVRNLYFPGVKKDSLRGQPISRDFFLASVYDEDTNNDMLINKKDLRRMYHFDKNNKAQTALLPAHYSAVRSTYDYKTDVMYIYARFDANKNGSAEKKEPISIFWVDLKKPNLARKMI